MAAILPLFAFISIYIIYYNLKPGLSWRQSFVRTSILWGTYLVLVTELLSIFHAITQPALVVAWSLPILAGIYIIVRKRKMGERLLFPRPVFSRKVLDWLLLAGLLFILGSTALIAWLAPPQTWDSLNYHLPRVAEWAQNRTVQHYITGVDSQNSKPPGAEFAILHFYVLAGSDRLANFVEWLAMLGSLVGVSWVARQLGANRTGQFLAVIIAATIPTGVVQASSTMTDYVVAFWVLCAVSEVLCMFADQQIKESAIFAGLAAGLVILTKPTGVPYLIPFILMAAWALLRHVQFRESLWLVGAACCLVLLLNLGTFTRNYLLYGNPISSGELISMQGNQLMNLQGMLSNVLRNAGLHAGTPKQSINQWVFDQVLLMHRWLGVDINDPRTTLHGQYNPIGGFALDEDVVGNLFHGLLILATIFGMIIGVKKFNRLSVFYTLAVIAGFFLFSLFFKWQIFGTRYHQVFFLLFSPIISIVAVRFLTPTGGRILGIALILAVYPWLFSIKSRPLIPIQGSSYSSSILTAARESLYFANGRHLEEPYTRMASMIQQANCSSVGLMLSGNEAEYPLWVLLGAPRKDLHIEWIVGGDFYQHYRTPNFQPCAVICESCPKDWVTLRGLPVVYDDQTFRLYLQESP
jgi:Dolichyl-phosphate-mannose-protein mannosyltransferase